MKILILGGNGFIGSHVVDELLSAGHSVRVFGRSADAWRAPPPSVRYYLGDFSNATLLAEALEGVDAVFHLISTMVPSTSNLDPIADIQSNLESSVKLFEAMVSLDVRRIVFLSSGGTVYGSPTVLPIPESHQLNPICSYGVVKIAIEKYLGMFSHLYGLEALIIRASNPYGPRQGYQGVQGVISTFMYKILSEEKLVIWGDGSTTRDYLYVSDLARLCRVAVESDLSGVYNAGAGKGVTLAEIVQRIEVLTGKKAVVEHMPARSFDVQEVVLDIDKAHRAFNWKPEVHLEDGLEHHYAWMSKNINLYPV